MTETWDSIADWYADRLAACSAPHQLAIAAMLQLLPVVTGQPVLDLGCGEGLAARALATQGAQVTGIDLSQRMIGHARRQEMTHPLGIDFQVGDAQALDGLADGAYAGVVANLLLNNAEDLGAAVGAVRRVLRPGGWLVFTLPIPALSPRTPARPPRPRVGPPSWSLTTSRSGSGARTIPRASAGPATGIGRWPPTSTP